MTIALIGGTGPLGRLVATELGARGIESRIVSRSAHGAGTARADIETGAGIADAIAGCDGVMLLASDFRRPREVDVAGARRVLEHIDDKHLIFISIVGVDRHPLPYYQAKHEVEAMIEESTARYSILRATQFHGFVASLIERMMHGPLCVVPWGYRYQPIDIGEVAANLADIARSGPGGRLPDLGGPEILGIADLARSFMTAIGKERPLLAVPRPGKVAAAYRAGLHTNQLRTVGLKTWSEWLGERYPTATR